MVILSDTIHLLVFALDFAKKKKKHPEPLSFKILGVCTFLKCPRNLTGLKLRPLW